MTEVEASDARQREIDDIFSLLAYSIVHLDWQSDRVPRERRRGYNIGAVLVSEDGRPVAHGLNCVTALDDATQHGELRAIQTFLGSSAAFDLRGFSLYATLEPCAMCAGMITMAGLRHVTYGQHDVLFGRTFERLALDTRSIDGYPPYPREVEVAGSLLPYCEELDGAFARFLELDPEKVLAKFLTSDVAHHIFGEARAAFLDHRVDHPDVQPVYEACRQYFDRLSDHHE